MKYFNRLKLGSCTHRIALCATALLCVLSACRDDTFDSFYNTEDNSPFINFKITDVSPGAEAFSRGDNDAFPGTIRNIYPLVSEESGDTLYLIESEVSGAYPVSSTSTQESRGEKINNYDGLVDDLGLYCFRTPEGGGNPAPDTELKFDQWKLKKGNSGNPYFHLYNPNVEDSLRDGKETWPGYPLDFVAYYPYQKAFKYDGETYSDANPKDADYRDELYGWMWSPDRTGMCMHPVPRNEMYLYYKVPESVDKQVDFMATYIKDKRGGNM